MRRFWCLSAMLAAGFAPPAPPAPPAPRQTVNADADASVARPAYPAGQGPRLVIDAGHRNRHTLSGSYAPFGALLANDGYRVGSNPGAFGPASLGQADILVIANALSEERGGSAFTEAEVAALHSWVEAGGALLLVADHTPFSGAAAPLAHAFGFEFREGIALNPGQRNRDVFRAGSGLADHVIFRGAGGDPAVTSVRTFSGSAFEAPGAEPLITLGAGFVLINTAGMAPGPTRLTDIPRQPAEGLLQGAVRTVGRGRVALIGEAAMMTAQVLENVPNAPDLGGFGFAAEQNKQFVLNLMHWLGRRPGY